jgi:hypothetical protein
MEFLLRWNGFADAMQLLLNVFDLITRSLALLRIQFRRGGSR